MMSPEIQSLTDEQKLIVDSADKLLVPMLDQLQKTGEVQVSAKADLPMGWIDPKLRNTYAGVEGGLSSNAELFVTARGHQKVFDNGKARAGAGVRTTWRYDLLDSGWKYSGTKAVVHAAVQTDRVRGVSVVLGKNLDRNSGYPVDDITLMRTYRLPGTTMEGRVKLRVVPREVPNFLGMMSDQWSEMLTPE